VVVVVGASVVAGGSVVLGAAEVVVVEVVVVADEVVEGACVDGVTLEDAGAVVTVLVELATAAVLESPFPHDAATKVKRRNDGHDSLVVRQIEHANQLQITGPHASRP